jgi:hypothetical protein
VVNFYGPADVELPDITIVDPLSGSSVGSSGATFLVSSTVTDDFGVAGAVVRFDVDGDGMISMAEEIVTSLELNGRWEVQVGPLAGPDEMRMLTVEATDVSGRFNEETIPVVVPEPGSLLVLVSGASFLAILERRRQKERAASHT